MRICTDSRPYRAPLVAGGIRTKGWLALAKPWADAGMKPLARIGFAVGMPVQRCVLAECAALIGRSSWRSVAPDRGLVVWSERGLTLAPSDRAGAKARRIVCAALLPMALQAGECAQEVAASHRDRYGQGFAVCGAVAPKWLA